MSAPLVIAGSTAGSALLGASAQYNAGKQAEATAQFNAAQMNRAAELAEQDALRVQEIAEFDLDRFRRSIRTLQSDVRHGYAKSGVDISEGTPFDVIQANYEMAKEDEYLIQYDADVRKAALYNQAEGARFQAKAEIQMGKYAKTGAKYRAMGTLLGGAADAGEQYMMLS